MWRFIKNFFGPLLILIIGVVTSYYFWSYFNSATQASINQTFEGETREVSTLIKENTRKYTFLLYGIQGLWGASQSVERSEFKQYVETLDLKNYQGLFLVAFSERVLEENKEDFADKIRKEGYEDFLIYPESNKSEYVVVKYLYPEDTTIMGLDVKSDSTRWEAQRLSIESGKEQLTESISLLDKEGSIGFGIVLPVFKRGMEINTIEKRIQAYEGVLSASFNAKTFFDNAFSEFIIRHKKNLRFEVYDALRGEEISSEVLVYKTDFGNNEEKGYSLYKKDYLDIAGRTWTVIFWGKPETFFNGIGIYLPMLSFIVGTVLSILAFALYHALNITKTRAEKRAEEITKDLVTSEERFKNLYESSGDAIMVIEPPDWKFTAGNPATLKIFNIKSEKIFKTLGPWDLSPKKQPDGQLSSKKAKEMIDRAIKDGSSFFEWVHKRYKGEDFYTTVLLTRLGAKGYVQATVRDISSEKEAEEKIQKRTKELERLNRAMVGRELKMAEMKKEIEQLRRKK